MKINAINTKFNVGDTISVIYYDTDIGAWNVATDTCKAIKIIVSEVGQKVEYTTDVQGDWFFAEEDDELFAHSLHASNKAREYNEAGHKPEDVDLKNYEEDFYPIVNETIEELKSKSKKAKKVKK